MNNKLPKVSVVTITYGHQDYILDTLKGVLMQEYNGEIEFIIANDNSPDETHRVVTEFLNTNSIPPRFEIKYTKHEKNLGMMPNFIWALKQATGDYIAMCEGDDYWIDPLKLQKQVDFLDANEDYVACQHYRYLLHNDGHMVCEKSENSIFTQCFMFRNLIDETFYKYIDNILNADTFLEYYLRLFGKIKYLEFNGAVYRLTGHGVFTSINDLEKRRNAIKTFKQILKVQKANKKLLNPKDLKTIQSKLTEYQILIALSSRFKLAEIIKYIFYVFRYNRFFYFIEYKRLIILLLRKETK